MTAYGRQVGGEHYTKYRIQPMEFFIANNINYPVAAVIKYVMRYQDKNGLEDLNKAIHIIEMLKEDYADRITGKTEYKLNDLLRVGEKQGEENNISVYEPFMSAHI